MLKLKRLKIHKCRSVQPGTELEFNDGLNIVLGKNGAGKTTLLKLVAAAVGSSFADEFHEDEIHVEYEYTSDNLSIRCEFRHDELEDSDQVSPAPTRSPTFIATFSIPDITPVIARLRGDRLDVTSGEHVESLAINANVLFAPSLDLVTVTRTYLANAEIPPSLRRSLVTADMFLTQRLDEGLDWLRQTLSSFAVLFRLSDDSERWCSPNVRHAGVAAAFRAAFAEYRDQFEELPEVLTVHSDALPFLREACRQLGLKDASWALSFLEHTRRVIQIKRYGNSQLYVTTPGGTRFPLEKLSFGQLRLFAFFLHSAMHPHVIVADELTNGLHHEMVDRCIDTIGERQAFLATQNPLLLDHIGFDDAEEVRRTFILCDTQDEPGGERSMRWRNMTSEEAHEFYADYKVGIQHVNDILRKRGLW